MPLHGLAVGHPGGLVAVVLQVAHQQLAQALVVIHHQYAAAAFGHPTSLKQLETIAAPLQQRGNRSSLI
jgi:hypothetical protein